MNQDQNLSEVLFFGMRLKAGREEVYSIENEEGQMEICHLTNCALVSDSISRKPVYVRMKAPDVDSEFVIGALVPGQVYSFTTDLILTPDTSFSHSGGPEVEVHLTGYRTVNSEAMFMGQDLEDTDDDMDEGVDDEEDDDFVVDDDQAEMQTAGADEDDEENEEDDYVESGEEEEEEEEDDDDELENKVVRDKVKAKGEKEFAKTAKERAKIKDIALHPDVVDMEIKALEGGNTFMWDVEDSESDLQVDEDAKQEGDDGEDLGPPEDEEVDDDEEVQRHMQELIEEDAEEDDEDSDDEDSDDEDEENAGAGGGSLLRVKQKSTPSKNGVRHAKKAGKSSEEEDEEEDEDADPSARAKAVTLARQQQDKIEREKQKQQLNGARKPSSAAESPAAAPQKSGKKRKASLGDEGDENHAVPAKKAATGVLAHPAGVNEATQKFAESMFKALQAAGKPMQMAQLSTKAKKPEGAEKMGKVVGKYECFKREAGKDIVSLAE